GRIYTPASPEVDAADMGAIPAAVLSIPGRVRGAHPLDSFTAAGPLAHALVDAQDAEHVHAPLEALAAFQGAVVLMGVGFERMTLLHLAEERAGRAPFVRWANGPSGEVVRARVGGCSEGFGKLAPVLAPLAREMTVGESRWLVLPAAETVAAAAAAIRSDPHLVHCGDPACDRCNDAVLGGPVLVE
ncbi:MAG TPA: AAC(3) family N-acetyltransferase, partial [Longimicrobiaceae bacterium]